LILHDTGLWLPSNRAAAQVARLVADDVRSRSPSSHRIKFIISPRGMLTEWALKFRSLKKRIAWALYQHRDLKSAHVLHATSRAEAEGFRALGLAQPIAIIPNGVELPGAEVSASVNQCFSISNTETPKHRSTAPPPSVLRTAFFLGRIHPIKGLINLVEAWHAVQPKDWRVVIAGGNENGHRAELESAIRDRGLTQQFEFIGQVPNDDKWALYQKADLFVLPSKSENFGIAIAEALASGVPVITTRGTPWEELVSHRCGWWVDVGSEPLAHALREATALSDSHRREMGRRGRQLIESKYTWPAAAQQMLAVYQWLLGTADRPECVV
jgi:glycosyltransferase involved in cell wall biosynthesis